MIKSVGFTTSPLQAQSLLVDLGHRDRYMVSVMKRILFIGSVVVILLGGALAGFLVFRPSAAPAAAVQGGQSSVVLGRCPTDALPLTAESVARAADQARIEMPTLNKDLGPAVVELAWRAIFRLNVWAATPFQCNSLVRSRTVVVDLLYPKMLPSASLSEGVVFVSLFPTGYQVWDVAH